MTAHVLDRNGIWHHLRPDETATMCGRDVPEDRPRFETPDSGTQCRPCASATTARTIARDHLAEARAALAAARPPQATTP